ncbi:MAG: hypothetical protein RQ866_04540, partial [Bacteroidales bacterium]|nr:hypothetical protein [Bacteroidales bacterium]
MIKVHSSIINRVKKGLVILAIIITVVFLLLFITAWVMESKVKKIVVNELNKTLITKVDVEDINLSLIRKFPYASLQFKNITVASAFNNDTNLLEANHLFLKFSIFDVIRGKYVTKKVDVENAKLYVKRNHQGNNNYDIWKSSGMNDTTDFYFDIKQVFLKNIAIVYLDEPTDFSFDVLIDKGTLQGAFSSMTYEMTLNGNLVINQIDIEGQKFFSGQQAATNINVLVDNYTYFYTINQSTLNIDGLSFSVKGIVNDADDAGIVDIKVISDNITLKEAIAILPQEYSHYLNQYDYYGFLNLSRNRAVS